MTSIGPQTAVRFHLHGTSNGELDYYCPDHSAIYALSAEYAEDVSPSHLCTLCKTELDRRSRENLRKI
jgi:hypothetical protein